MRIEIYRDQFFDDCTLGTLTAPIALGSSEHGFECFTVECPWMGGANLHGESCILPGDYAVVLYDSPRLGYEVLLLKDVPGREAIEMHFANWVFNPETGIRELEGCIAPGMRRNASGVEGSRIAFMAIRSLARAALSDGETVTLSIRNRNDIDTTESGSSVRA